MRVLRFTIMFGMLAAFHLAGVNVSADEPPDDMAQSAAAGDTMDTELDSEINLAAKGTPRIQQVTPPALREISDEGGTFLIPYIQQSTTLDVSVKVNNLPNGGGVEFILNGNSTFDMRTPFARSFSVTPGEHQLEIYLVNRNRRRLTNSAAHAGPQQIGIGNLTTTIGDSITAGNFGDSSPGPILNCEQSPTASEDCRNYFQHSASSGTYYRGYQVRANDCLTDATGAAQFLMNDGFGGSTSQGVLNRIDIYKQRIEQYDLSQALLLIGTNDANQGVSPDQWQQNVEAIINQLKATGIDAAEIYLGRVPYRKGNGAGAEASRLAIRQYNMRIPSIAAATGISIGPDFYAYFEAHQSQLADNLHPNQSGYDAMAGLWTQSVTGSTICRP